MTPQEQLEEAKRLKLDMISMKLQALDDPNAIASLLVDTLDPDSLLYFVQRDVLSKLVDCCMMCKDRITQLESINNDLSINNSILAGYKTAEEAKDEPSEYDKIMNSED